MGGGGRGRADDELLPSRTSFPISPSGPTPTGSPMPMKTTLLTRLPNSSWTVMTCAAQVGLRWRAYSSIGLYATTPHQHMTGGPGFSHATCLIKNLVWEQVPGEAALSSGTERTPHGAADLQACMQELRLRS